MKSIVVFLFMILGFSSVSFAGCPSPNGSSHLIITIEGLMGAEVFGSPAKKMIRRSKPVNAKVASYSNRGLMGANIRGIMKCISKWEGSKGKNFRLSVTGHSFGGRDAVKLAKAMQKKGLKDIDELILLDARNGSDGSSCKGTRGNGKIYQIPTNVRVTRNFFQCGGGLKARMASGNNVRNIQVGGDHISMPKYAAAPVSRLLRGSTATGGRQLASVGGRERFIPEATTANPKITPKSSGGLGDWFKKKLSGKPRFSRQIREAEGRYRCNMRNKNSVTTGRYFDCSKEQRDLNDQWERAIDSK